MTLDIESVRKLIESTDGDARKLIGRHDSSLFIMRHLLMEVERLWTKYPAEADHTWKSFRSDPRESETDLVRRDLPA